MKIIFQAIHFTAQDELKEFVETKLSKLEHFYDQIVSAHVYLKLENVNDKKNKTAEIKLEVPGEDFIASKTEYSFEEAIDNVVDALKRQIEKRKNQQKK